MNNKTLKLIRKWCRYREFDYKAVKGFFENLPPEDQMNMVLEMSQYNDAVDTGVIQPGRPELPQNSQNGQSEAKTEKNDSLQSPTRHPKKTE